MNAWAPGQRVGRRRRDRQRQRIARDPSDRRQRPGDDAQHRRMRHGEALTKRAEQLEADGLGHLVGAVVDDRDRERRRCLPGGERDHRLDRGVIPVGDRRAAQRHVADLGGRSRVPAHDRERRLAGALGNGQRRRGQPEAVGVLASVRRGQRGRQPPCERGNERRDHQLAPIHHAEFGASVALSEPRSPRLGICSRLSRAYTHDRDDQLRRDPQHVPGVLRVPRASAAAVGLAGAGRLRPFGAVHRSGYASAQALLPGCRAAAAQPRDDLPDVFPDAGHRDHRHHHPAPDAVRDARQLLVRRLLQARGRAVRLGALDAGVWLSCRGHLDHGVRRRRRARPRTRSGGDRRLAGDRRAP